MAVILQSMFEIFDLLGKVVSPVHWKQIGNRHTTEVPFQKLPPGFKFSPTSSGEGEEDDTALVGQEFPHGHYLATIFAPSLSMMKPLSGLVDLSNPNAKRLNAADVSFSVVLQDEQGRSHEIYSDLNLPSEAVKASLANLVTAIKEKLESIRPAVLTYSGAGDDERRKKVYDYIGKKVVSNYVRVPNDELGLSKSASVWIDRDQVHELPAIGKLATWISKNVK